MSCSVSPILLEEEQVIAVPFFGMEESLDFTGKDTS